MQFVQPIKIFCSYAPKDQIAMDKLEEHLSVLVRNRQIDLWHAGKILPGADEAHERSIHLKQADIILLIVSRGYMASHQCYDIEAIQAVDMANAGIAYVGYIPYRHVLYEEAVFSGCPNLLKDGKFVYDWPNNDKPLWQICQEIHLLVTEAYQDRAWREENRKKFEDKNYITRYPPTMPPLRLKRPFRGMAQNKQTIIQAPERKQPQKQNKPTATPAPQRKKRTQTSSSRRKGSPARIVTNRVSGQSSILTYKPISRKFEQNRGIAFIVLFILDVVGVPLTMRSWWDSWLLVAGTAIVSFLIFAEGTLTRGSFIPVLMSFLIAAIWGSIIVHIFTWPPAIWALCIEIGSLILVASAHYILFRRR